MNARLVFLVLTFLLAGSAFAQSDPVAPPNNALFTQPELDQMLAPVALYPDPLLTEVLTAATYPLEIVEAARWSQANPDLNGTDAVDAADGQNWDPNVKALLAFPDLLQMMSDKIDWTQNLGDAFLGQQAQVMDTVQGLRQRAEASGNLQSGGELRVDNGDGNIDIEPAAPDLVYLPYYDPTVVYGTWWWSAYPPVCWTPWPGYYFQGAFGYGTGVAIGIGFFHDGFDWRRHRIDVFDHGRSWRHGTGFAHGAESHVWQHDPAHRRNVIHQNVRFDQRLGRTGATIARPEFHGDGRALPPAGPVARAQRGDLNERMPRSYAAPSMQRNFAPRVEAPFEGNGRMMPNRGGFGGGAHMSAPRAPARGAGSSSHRR